MAKLYLSTKIKKIKINKPKLVMIFYQVKSKLLTGLSIID